MVDLGAYKNKFGDSDQRILEHALNESPRPDQNFEHFRKKFELEVGQKSTLQLQERMSSERITKIICCLATNSLRGLW
jgi:hypothetical protein